MKMFFMAIHWKLEITHVIPKTIANLSKIHCLNKPSLQPILLRLFIKSDPTSYLITSLHLTIEGWVIFLIKAT